MWCAGKGAVFMKISANTELFHHIRPFGAPSPQGEGFGAQQLQAAR